ncbi:MAG: AMP-binding protein, partial [Candidatus Marinimicrobia bacterium]|nr:AMP-binding protein [Candidatus Neomarinimicrobiota bacterium]
MAELTLIVPELEITDPEQWERHFRRQLQQIYEFNTTAPDSLAEEILHLGQSILERGTPHQQEVLLDQGRQRGFIDTLENLGLTHRWFELEWALISKLNFTPGRLMLLRQQQFPQKVLLRYQSNFQWQELNWTDVVDFSRRFAASILGLTQNKPGPIAIISENRVEVALADIACLSYGILNVPIQPSLPPQQLAYILDHAGIEIAVISNSGVYERLQAALPFQSTLKQIISLDELSNSGGLPLHRWSKLQQPLSQAEYKQLEVRRAAIKLDDIASLMYTSGTTGHPKAIEFTY